MKKGCIITIIGQSGVGKTYLASRLAREMNVDFFPEPEGKTLPKFVQKAFFLQKNLLKAHEWFARNLEKRVDVALKMREQGKRMIMDTHPKIYIFYAQAFLSKTEAKKIAQKIQLLLRKFPKNDPIIYLQNNKKSIVERRKKRGYQHETLVENTIGEQRVARNMKFFFINKKNVIFLKREKHDFSKPENIQHIISMIFKNV